MIEASWLAPAITRDQMLQVVKRKYFKQEHEFHRMVVDGVWGECCRAKVNFNRFAFDESVEKAMDERTVFSELVASGIPIAEAWSRRTEPFIPKGDSPWSLSLDKKTRYQQASSQWVGREAEIIYALLSSLKSAKRPWRERHPEPKLEVEIEV